MPEERDPLRMNGPSKSDRDALGKSMKRMEHASMFAGGAVVIGVVVEVWPDILSSVTTPHLPHIDTIGAIIVAVGVAVEVLMASRIARKAETIQELADRELAELNLETERLRKENNEFTALLSFRSIGDPQEFVEAMKPFAGTRFAFGIFGPRGNQKFTSDTKRFAGTGRMDQSSRAIA